MKVGEIWESNDIFKEKVCINYIHFVKFDWATRKLADDGCYVGYTYLEEPIDNEVSKTEEMIPRSWFISEFTKCH